MVKLNLRGTVIYVCLSIFLVLLFYTSTFRLLKFKSDFGLELQGERHVNQTRGSFFGKKVCVVVSGFAPRGYSFVHERFKDYVIKPLELVFDVDVYHFSLASKSHHIETNRKAEPDFNMNNTDILLYPARQTLIEYQEDLEDFLIEDIDLYDKCYHSNNHRKNMLRELYSEYQTLYRFPIEEYKAVVLLWSDQYPITKINVTEVGLIANEENPEYNRFYGASFNRFGGIGNKYFIGKPNVLRQIASRMYNHTFYCEEKVAANPEHLHKGLINPEAFLRDWVSFKSLMYMPSSYFFLKIRGNGKSNQYIDFVDNYDLPPGESARIKKQFS